MSIIQATFDQGVFRPTEPVNLPDKCEVELEVHVRPGPSPSREEVSGQASIEDRLAALAAQVPSEEWERLPKDLTDRLEDYINGAGEP